MEELIKNWKTVRQQMQIIDMAIAEAEEAECHLTRPGAPQALKVQVAQLKYLNDSVQDIYLKVADYYHQHPALRHIPEAKVSTRARINNEERRASLAALQEERELRMAGQSVSTSYGQGNIDDYEDLVPCLT